jgi:acetyl-CoA carboxylase biotin carboxyl carrier protein
MVENDLSEIDLRDEQEQVSIRRPGPAMAPVVTQVAAQPVAPAQAPTPSAAPAADADPHAGCIAIESPMVGTFYEAPAPDKPAFVKVGDSIDAETVVCLLEAMKIFNEIKAECSGVVERVLVSNADSVEFGQSLFLVRPD